MSQVPSPSEYHLCKEAGGLMKETVAHRTQTCSKAELPSWLSRQKGKAEFRTHAILWIGLSWNQSPSSVAVWGWQDTIWYQILGYVGRGKKLLVSTYKLSNVTRDSSWGIFCSLARWQNYQNVWFYTSTLPPPVTQSLFVASAHPPTPPSPHPHPHPWSRAEQSTSASLSR